MTCTPGQLYDCLREKSRFADKMKDRGLVTQEFKDAREADGPVTYQKTTDEKRLKEAQERVASDPDGELEKLKAFDGKDDGTMNTVGQELTRHYMDEASKTSDPEKKETLINKALEANAKVSQDLSKAGQQVQAAAQYEKFTPTGALRNAQKLIDDANDGKPKPPDKERVRKIVDDRDLTPKQKEAKLNQLLKDVPAKPRKAFIDRLLRLSNLGGLTDQKYHQAIADKLGLSQLDGESAQKIFKLAEDYQKLPDNTAKEKYAKALVGARILKATQDLLPVSGWQKFGKYQTMSMLSGTRTIGRNVIGNVSMAGLKLAGDAARGKGSNPRLIAAAVWRGLKEGTQEAIEGIDTKSLNDKSIGYGRRVFTGKNLASRFLRRWEQVFDVVMRAPDRAIYEGMRTHSLEVQKKSKGFTGKVTPEIELQAHLDGLEAVFQQDSAPAKLLSSWRRSLNELNTVIPGFNKEYGLGDVFIKFAQVPANILASNFYYSPIGFLRAFTIMGKELGPMQKTHQLATVLTQASTGVGLMWVAWQMANLGIITPTEQVDRDRQENDRLRGMKPGHLNTSSLVRYVASGFDPVMAAYQPGDDTIAYVDLPVVGSNLAASANTVSKGKEKQLSGADIAYTMATAMLESVNAQIDTALNLPVTQGIKKLVGGREGLGQAITEGVADVPATLIPQLVNQGRQLIDNTRRETSDPNLAVQVGNQIRNRIPGASQGLPARMTPAGEEAKGTEQPYDVFNTFLNPIDTGKVKADPVADELERVYQGSGEKKHFLRLTERKPEISINGKAQRRELTGKERSDYQKDVGQTSRRLYQEAMSHPDYGSLPDEQKAALLSGIMTNVNTAAKMRLFGHAPAKVSKLTQAILDGDNDAISSEIESKVYRQMDKADDTE